MRPFCLIDGLECPVPAGEPRVTLTRADGARLTRQVDALVLTGRGRQLVALARAAGCAELPLVWGWRSAGVERVLLSGALDLTRAELHPAHATVPLSLAPEATWAEAGARVIDLWPLGPLSPTWFDSPVPGGAPPTTHAVLPVADALARLVASASDHALSVSAECFGPNGPWHGLALAPAAALRGAPARLPISLDELLWSLRRLLALGTWREGSTLHVAPLAVCYGESTVATLDARGAQMLDQPAEDLEFGQIEFGYAYTRSVASPLPLVHGPQRARRPNASSAATLDLRLPWLADPAALEWLRTHPVNPELLEVSSPLDSAVAVIDRVWAPHAAMGGAAAWQLQRGVAQASGLPSPEQQPAWALSPPAQLARWAPLWAACGRQVVLAPTPGPAVSAAGPPERMGVTYTLAGRPYAEPTQALSTEGPLTSHSPLSGRALSVTLSLSPEALLELLAALDADPRGRIRLRREGPRYAEGWLQRLEVAPHSGRVQLTLLTPA